MSLILQDIILNQARRDKIKVNIILCNSQQIEGTVRGFDNFTIIIDVNDDMQTMIYKYNVITITPKSPILVDSYTNNGANYE